jgi:hypothetical protein
MLNRNKEVFMSFILVSLFGYEMSSRKTLVLKVWSPTCGTILGGAKNFRRWGLAGGSRTLSEFLVCLSLLPGHHEVNSPYHMLLVE